MDIELASAVKSQLNSPVGSGIPAWFMMSRSACRRMRAWESPLSPRIMRARYGSACSVPAQIAAVEGRPVSTAFCGLARPHQ